jgi:single-strand DNA-binding protein
VDKDNIKRYSTEILADEIKLLGRRADGQGVAPAASATATVPVQQPAAAPVSAPVVQTEDPDDLPF